MRDGSWEVEGRHFGFRKKSGYRAGVTEAGAGREPTTPGVTSSTPDWLL